MSSNKKKYPSKFEQYVSDIERENDELTYHLITFEKLSILQSICNFNVFWIWNLSPVLLHIETVRFLCKHKKKFKKKMTIKQLFNFDMIIYWMKPENFNDFKSML